MRIGAAGIGSVPVSEERRGRLLAHLRGREFGREPWRSIAGWLSDQE